MKKSAWYLLAFFLIGFGIRGPLSLWLGDDPQGQIVMNILILCVMTILPGAAYLWENKIRVSAFFKGRLSFVAVGKVCVLSVGVWCLGSVLNSIAALALERLGMELPTQLPQMETPMALILGFCNVVVVAPILEEFFFRGALLDGARRSGGAVAVVGSSLLFALAHGHPAIFFLPLVYGMFAGYVVMKSGNLTMGIIMHSICNFLSWTADRTNLVGEIPGAMGMLAGALITLGLGIVLLFRHPVPIKKLVKECCCIPMGLVALYYCLTV